MDIAVKSRRKYRRNQLGAAPLLKNLDQRLS
jgi:hypothetical protein